MTVVIKDLKGFLEVLHSAKRTASSKNDDIRSGLLLKASGTSLSIRAMDLVIGLEMKEDGLIETSEETSFLVPADLFEEMMKNLPKGEVSFIHLAEENRVNIKAGKSNYSVSTMNIEEYPALEVIEEGTRFRVKGSIFSDALDSVIHAASESETRPILTGVHVVSNGKYLTLIATDSHRLAAKAMPLVEACEEFKNIVIPQNAVKELAKVLANVDDCEVLVAANKLTFKTNKLNFTTRLLEGSYPDITNLIPKEFVCEATVNREELLNACERAKKILKPDKGKVAEFKLKNSELPVMNINIKSSISSGVEELFIGNMNGDMNIRLNVYFLHSTLSSFSSKEVQLQFAGEIKPMLIKPVSENQAQFGLLLPVR
jgi:DNA polymerase-3 subunit beta